MWKLQSKNIPDVSIADEPLVLTQSDMDRSNFSVDTTERPVILDPGEIGWLPESLGLSHSSKPQVLPMLLLNTYSLLKWLLSCECSLI